MTTSHSCSEKRSSAASSEAAKRVKPPAGPRADPPVIQLQVGRKRNLQWRKEARKNRTVPNFCQISSTVIKCVIICIKLPDGGSARQPLGQPFSTTAQNSLPFEVMTTAQTPAVMDGYRWNGRTVCQCQTRLNRRLLMGRVSKHHHHHRLCLCHCHHCHQPSNSKHQEGQHQDSHHCHRWQQLRFQSLQLQFQQLICIVADMVYNLYCITLAPSDNTASRCQ